MKVVNQPDFEVSSDACKAATGKSFDEWFAELDANSGEKAGRRENTQLIYAQTKDTWWSTTLAVEYEKSKGQVKKDGLLEGFTICVTKNINAPVSKVYATWIEPGAFKSMFGDNGRQDVEEGGEITCDAGCKGAFTRVRPDKDLRFTWEHPGCSAPMTVDVQFQDAKGKTLMNVMTSRIQTRGEADGLRNAWAAFLVELKSRSES
jgi:uncharacterized protein YndB with AHSA1/START domain